MGVLLGILILLLVIVLPLCMMIEDFGEYLENEKKEKL